MNTELAVTHIPDRGGVILALGILSVLFLGPLSGIPAWLMANQDLKDTRSGIVNDPSGLVHIGRAIAVIGTFLSPLWLIIYFVLAEMAIAMVSMLGALA